MTRHVASMEGQWRNIQVGKAYLELKVPEIVGKQRHRTTRTGHVYTPHKTVCFEKLVRDAWLSEHGDKWASHDGPVEMFVYATRELAKSNPKYWAGRQDVGKPDSDNIAKSALDALNGVAFKDDALVTRCACQKCPRAPHGSGNVLQIHITYFEEEYF